MTVAMVINGGGVDLSIAYLVYMMDINHCQLMCLAYFDCIFPYDYDSTSELNSEFIFWANGF